MSRVVSKDLLLPPHTFHAAYYFREPPVHLRISLIVFVFFPGRMFPGGGCGLSYRCDTTIIIFSCLRWALRAYELKNLLAKSSIIFPMASTRASSPTTGMVLISGMVHCVGCLLFEIEYMGRLMGY
jgi:hypothetical protein